MDRQTDRQSATQYAAPPREEGRIIIDLSDVNILPFEKEKVKS